VDEENWGPRPIRMLKCSQFVLDKWRSFRVDGWGGFFLKEKCKLIKMALKEWHMSHCNNIPAKIDSLKA